MNNSRTFIFFTQEGFCEAPNGEKVENYQVLGFESGENIETAFRWLMINNLWIEECGYDREKIQWKELI